MAFEFDPAAVIYGEERFLPIGKVGPFYWTDVITYRFGKVRFISVRRSRDTEKKLHQST
jgi:uncharacterized DUF497 family protein